MSLGDSRSLNKERLGQCDEAPQGAADDPRNLPFLLFGISPQSCWKKRHGADWIDEHQQCEADLGVFGPIEHGALAYTRLHVAKAKHRRQRMRRPHPNALR